VAALVGALVSVGAGVAVVVAVGILVAVVVGTGAGVGAEQPPSAITANPTKRILANCLSIC
jgi:hypothetical protein